jgi:light-regulated signal transduction histidine kinase (bacteriophytochrome)
MQSRDEYLDAPLDRAMIRDAVPSRLAAGRRKDGSEFSIEAGLGPLLVNARPHVVAMVRDITERLEAQAALTALNRELEERVDRRTAQLRRSLEEMASFSYAVAHDLRAPLRAIAGFASLMRMDGVETESERDEMLGKISEAAQRMALQIDGLLALSQLSRTQLNLHQQDLAAIARYVIAELRRVEPDRVVDVQIEDDMRCLADPSLLQSLMENLIGNAWKYTARTPGASIRVGKRDREGVAGFYVADNGAGFDMKYADRLFEVFQRMHRQEDFAGVGIGLATVRRIIERHGGTIHADASPGQGATFWFSMPD